MRLREKMFSPFAANCSHTEKIGVDFTNRFLGRKMTIGVFFSPEKRRLVSVACWSWTPYC